ncbi:Unknown protein [Striga hermonthica]|uniref:Retrovirus-related Pol polyprotein from transposon TNT 1-94-like beta-barrel domain-containing protein n=1 Tax=Striga hermonthica TaxID=68872 RepID=A0A9N7MH16_STRHE|nr:Unknown protein [Striga hermonthica]
MSTDSSSSSTTSSTISSSSSTTTFAPIPVHHAVRLRLSKTNYTLWRAQLLPFLRGSDLLGYLDGSIAAPSKYVPSSTAEGAELISNPAYTRWYNQDQQILSGMLSSITEEMLPDVVDAATSKEAWDTLQRMFSSANRARAVQVRLELVNTKKRDLTAADYFRKIKGYATELAAAGNHLSDDEITAYLLAGLPPDYDPYVTSITNRSDRVTIDDAYNYLLAFEARQLQYQAEAKINVGSTANYAGRGGPSRGRGRGTPSTRARGRGGFALTNQGRGSRGPPFSTDRPNRGPPCQICGRSGHTAIRCWYRMDESYQDDPPSAAVAATSSYKIDPNWYVDTGATDHIINDLDRLTFREQYHGNDTVQVGNGAGLNIWHTGSCSINTANRPLNLKNVLHVPNISKHLLSVHKLARDNNVVFEFHPYHFLIKDRATKQVLLDGRCEPGLYPINPSAVVSSKQAFVGVKASPNQWNARFGHPSTPVVKYILRLHNLPCVQESMHADQQTRENPGWLETQGSTSAASQLPYMNCPWAPQNHRYLRQLHLCHLILNQLHI